MLCLRVKTYSRSIALQFNVRLFFPCHWLGDFSPFFFKPSQFYSLALKVKY